ncbi:beta-glucanase [Streptomyces sp. NPDC051907]|uniref:beta-glucanase n=1 Tax=Streptomyces sp. NPDC051907 TaxID=3155284 RepID=UPI003420A99C
MLLQYVRRRFGGHDGPPLEAPPQRGEPVFTADFASTEQWVQGRSWAYPNGGPTNRGDDKRDHLVVDPSYCRAGVFRATRRPEGSWSTGLLTTEGSAEGFMVQTGDVLEASVRLPEENGAWPAVWTWYEGGNEVDVFEYHPDNPDLLELSNRVGDRGHCYRHEDVRPGARIELTVEFGAKSVVWWVNGAQAYADRAGVGRHWRAYLIVNLSVCAGTHHPPPDATASAMSYEVDALRVFRP